jgi:hypothetical protein
MNRARINSALLFLGIIGIAAISFLFGYRSGEGIDYSCEVEEYRLPLEESGSLKLGSVVFWDSALGQSSPRLGSVRFIVGISQGDRVPWPDDTFAVEARCGEFIRVRSGGHAYGGAWFGWLHVSDVEMDP